ncbi:hypothetical protein JOF56_006658 [Kibdelosporangium banguiense]|uniref:Uncharacterized protein n=1 Tax=Kibdelosporangium banguiense TaxID=1365924 RepID=A0ABS4TQU1_9PSEU|nr:hypothetical protein [Kibdelosporangium banguiense]MBP2326273.1 hypothetical protein [Kibdelosporangium banguiense]
MEDDRELLDRARAGARELVHVARDGDTDGVFQALRRLTERQGIVGSDTRLIVGQLVSASAEMMLQRVGTAPDEVTYAVDLRDDEQFNVPIDELEPPLRATVRALLAELNGLPDEADFQLDLALREQNVPTTLDVVVHSLLWTIGLLEWCEAEQKPAPEWLSSGRLCN